MNFALGIPGTVGGAIIMNAGTSHGSMENVLESINVLLPTGDTRRIKKEGLDFNYRNLSWNPELTDGYEDQTIILDGRSQVREIRTVTVTTTSLSGLTDILPRPGRPMFTSVRPADRTRPLTGRTPVRPQTIGLVIPSPVPEIRTMTVTMI